MYDIKRNCMLQCYNMWKKECEWENRGKYVCSELTIGDGRWKILELQSVFVTYSYHAIIKLIEGSRGSIVSFKPGLFDPIEQSTEDGLSVTNASKLEWEIITVWSD